MSLDDVLHDDGAPLAKPSKQNRGFATMTPETQREVARKGGRIAHAKGTAHEWSSETARQAGAKGGKTHSREHLAEIGRRGGAARKRNAEARAAAERGE